MTRRVLHDLVSRAVPNAAASIECRTPCDLPARALLEHAVGADLLVVGARGYGGFRGLVLGSVSQQCAHHTTVPIAIVRRVDPENAAPDRIVVGIDGSAPSRNASAWALDEARARRARLTIVHAWRPALLGAIDYAAPVLTSEALEATAKRTVDDALAESDVDGLAARVDISIVDGGAAPAILRAAADRVAHRRRVSRQRWVRRPAFRFRQPARDPPRRLSGRSGPGLIRDRPGHRSK